MGVSVTLTVRANECPRIAGQFEGNVARVLNRAVDVCIAVADPLTRRDTGALVGNKAITYASEGSLSAEVAWNQEYAIYQNSGTVYTSGTFFADSGAEAGGQAIAAGMGGIVT